MDCLTLGEGGGFLARCFGESALLAWRNWWTSPPATLLTLLLAAPLLLRYSRRWRGRLQQKQMAHRRAEQLLRERLTPGEYKHLQRYGFLDIASDLNPQRYYRIPRYKGRVWVYEASMQGETLLWRKTAELCVIATEDVPDADLVLSHKWMIEGDEASYLALANWIKVPAAEWTIHVGARPALERDVAR